MTTPAIPSLGVSRQGRLDDLVSLACFLAGAACYGWAYLGMRALERDPSVSLAQPLAAMVRFDRYWWVSRIGILLIAASVVVAVGAAVLERRRRARQASPPGS